MNLHFDDRDRESVSRDLGSADDEVRRLAVERVEALPRDQVVPRLVECLGDTSWRVRKAAVSRLVAWPDDALTASLLIQALYDGENPGRRNAAVEALVQAGRVAVPHLIDAADTDDSDVRKFFVDALAGIGDPLAVETLIERLSDVDPNVCGSAADALGAIGGDMAEGALREAAADALRPSLVRFSALRALDLLEVEIASAELADALSDRMLRPAAIALLGRAEDDVQAVDILLKSLSDPARSCRESAIQALLRVCGASGPGESAALEQRIREESASEPQIVEGAIDRLPDAELSLQLALVQFLGVVGDARAAIPVLEVGVDEALEAVSLTALHAMGVPARAAIEAAWPRLDARARRNACSFFAESEGPGSADRLLEALEDADVGVRIGAARALTVRDVDGDVAGLVALLERSAEDDEFEGEEERLAVTRALVEMSERRGEGVAGQIVARLSRMLEGHETARLAAAAVLGGVGRAADIDTVTLMLRDASASVRKLAVDALARIGSDACLDALHMAVADESSRVRVAAAGALGRLGGPESFHDLVCLVGDGEPRVRAAAVRALATRMDAGRADEREAALEVVERACGDVAHVALAAIEVVARLGTGAVEQALALLQRPEPDVVREAVRCLAEHGEDPMLDGVVPLVAHADWSVRAEAIQTLPARRVTRAVPAILRRLDTEQDEYVRSVTLRALQRLES